MLELYAYSLAKVSWSSIAVGTFPLRLPSGLLLNLNNYYYVPALSMDIISGSCLLRDGYSFKSENFSVFRFIWIISFMFMHLRGMVYFC